MMRTVMDPKENAGRTVIVVYENNCTDHIKMAKFCCMLIQNISSQSLARNLILQHEVELSFNFMALQKLIILKISIPPFQTMDVYITYTHTHTHMHTCMHTYTWTHTHTYICTHTHTHTHTHTWMHTHMQTVQTHTCLKKEKKKEVLTHKLFREKKQTV